ncbi:MAG TPA: 3-dehydroquinate synthase [Candidatus Binataceae bacterium]|nr:3-dehydroquinate synthase [Candidatus Binataceae bacterium]
MGTFRVELGPRSHPVHVGAGLLDQVGKLARDAGVSPGRVALITDSNVATLYAPRTADALRSAGLEASVIEVTAGETSKSVATLSSIYDRMAAAEIERSGAVFALGGGVVGDLAGFVAATWLRGVAVVQIPTTLTAQVDSALGGKTGINLASAKNLVGAFHQPRAIIADVATLSTLPEREFREGFGEVIKYGAILDAPMIADLERDLPRLLARDGAALEGVVERSLLLKAKVVTADEHEGGLRKILNFGHTVGHALEAISGYGKYLHGEAVAVGMKVAAHLSEKFAGLSADESSRLIALIERTGLPTSAPELGLSAQIAGAMRLDKKRRQGDIEFVLLDRLGHAVTRPLGLDAIQQELSR